MRRPSLTLALLIATPLLLQAQIRSYEVSESFSSGTASTFDLAWDGTHLWLAHGEGEMSRYNPSDGEKVSHFQTEHGELRGLSFDGEDLWAAESGTGELHRIDPRNGRDLESIPSPVSERGKMSRPSGLAWDGEALWNNDTRTVYCGRADEDLTVRFQPGMATEKGFDGIHDCPFGLAYGAGHLWVGENSRDRIYMIDPDGYEVVDSMEAPGDFVNGLAYGDDGLWVATNDGKEDDIHRLSLSLEEEGNEIKREVELQVRPNPTSGATEVELTGEDPSGSMRMEVYSSDGQKVLHRAFEAPQERLDLSGLAEGSYIIRLLDEKGATHKRKPLLIQRP